MCLSNTAEKALLFLLARKHSQAALWSLLVPRRSANKCWATIAKAIETQPDLANREVIPPQIQEESKL